MNTVKFTREPDPAEGVRSYRVTVNGAVVGTVTNRRGNWWRAFTADGKTRGAFHYTRRSAAEALLR